MDNKEVLATFLAITLDNCNQNYADVLKNQYKWLDEETTMSAEEFKEFWDICIKDKLEENIKSEVKEKPKLSENVDNCKLINFEAIKVFNIKEMAMFLACTEDPNEYYKSLDYFMEYLKKKDGENILNAIRYFVEVEADYYPKE